MAPSVGPCPHCQNAKVRRLFLLSFIWGWSFLFIKVAVEGLTPTTVACARVALGAAFLLAFLRIKGHALPRDPTIWRQLAVVGLVGSALPFTMLAWGEERITSALTSVLNASTPLFTAALAAVVLRDRLRAVQVGGLLVGLIGVGVAAGIGRGDLAGSSLAGSAASVLAGACYGFSFTWSKKHLMGITPLVAAFGQLATAAVILAPFAVATSAADGISMTPGRAIAVVLLGVVGSGVAYVLNFRILADVGATRASLVTYLIPVVAVAVGVLVLDEPFHLRILLGGLLIVAGILTVHRGRADRPTRPDRASRSPRRLRPVPAPLTALIAAASLGLVGAACSEEDRSQAACGPIRREALDRRSLVHVLPAGPVPDYPTDPPTSGPHQPAPPVEGVVDRAIDRPVQVGILEGGRILLQHRDLDAGDRRRLEELAGPEVVVAPAVAGLPGDAVVVATAWLAKRTCTAVDLDALSTFVDRRAGRGPGGHG